MLSWSISWGQLCLAPALDQRGGTGEVGMFLNVVVGKRFETLKPDICELESRP